MCNREIECMSENAYTRPPNGFSNQELPKDIKYVPASLLTKFEEFRSHLTLTPEIEDCVSDLFSSTVIVICLIKIVKKSISIAEDAEEHMLISTKLTDKFIRNLQEVNCFGEAVDAKTLRNLEKVASCHQFFYKIANDKLQDARKATLFLLVAISTAKQLHDELLSKLSPEQKFFFRKVFGNFLE